MQQSFYPSYLKAKYPHKLWPSTSHFRILPKDKNARLGVQTLVDWSKDTLLADIEATHTITIHQHSIDVGTHHVYDPYFLGYLLHSCTPNARLEGTKLFALTDIKKQSFITIDYQKNERKLYKNFHCSCLSASCRSFITGYDTTDAMAR